MRCKFFFPLFLTLSRSFSNFFLFRLWDPPKQICLHKCAKCEKWTLFFQVNIFINRNGLKSDDAALSLQLNVRCALMVYTCVEVLLLFLLPFLSFSFFVLQNFFFFILSFQRHTPLKNEWNERERAHFGCALNIYAALKPRKASISWKKNLWKKKKNYEKIQSFTRCWTHLSDIIMLLITKRHWNDLLFYYFLFVHSPYWLTYPFLQSVVHTFLVIHPVSVQFWYRLLDLCVHFPLVYDCIQSMSQFQYPETEKKRRTKFALKNKWRRSKLIINICTMVTSKHPSYTLIIILCVGVSFT